MCQEVYFLRRNWTWSCWCVPMVTGDPPLGGSKQSPTRGPEEWKGRVSEAKSRRQIWPIAVFASSSNELWVLQCAAPRSCVATDLSVILSQSVLPVILSLSVPSVILSLSVLSLSILSVILPLSVMSVVLLLSVQSVILPLSLPSVILPVSQFCPSFDFSRFCPSFYLSHFCRSFCHSTCQWVLSVILPVSSVRHSVFLISVRHSTSVNFVRHSTCQVCPTLYLC